MTPAVPSAMTISKEHLPLNNKLRKPVVEKMCRDRINSSIEQLKILLTPDFLNQQPDHSKAVSQGFSRCVHEVLHFLCKEEMKTQSQRKLPNHFQNLQPSTEEKWRESDLPLLSSTDHLTISKEKSSVQSALWRPW
uniref:Orange domain-containing protein n=1 Tax=Pygocentrus nattereri TaxID=42514 RepID=A0A3B4DCZ8_PYGNA